MPRRSGAGRVRKWALKDLDRERRYTLYFDQDSWSWEVLDPVGAEVVTRPEIAERRARSAERRNARARSARELSSAGWRSPSEDASNVSSHSAGGSSV